MLPENVSVIVTSVLLMRLKLPVTPSIPDIDEARAMSKRDESKDRPLSVRVTILPLSVVSVNGFFVDATSVSSTAVTVSCAVSASPSYSVIPSAPIVKTSGVSASILLPLNVSSTVTFVSFLRSTSHESNVTPSMPDIVRARLTENSRANSPWLRVSVTTLPLKVASVSGVSTDAVIVGFPSCA